MLFLSILNSSNAETITKVFHYSDQENALGLVKYQLLRLTFVLVTRLKSLLFLFIFVLIIDCRAISMGQGQEIHARKLVGQFMQTVCDHYF